MPTQQAFDGDTLEAALARVTETCGPAARIMQADKVRTGGFAGFFARERYEVIVEVDDPGDAATGAGTSPQPPEPMSLLDLVEQVSAHERTAIPTDAPGPASSSSATYSSVPVPSTEGPTFHEVLREIATQAGLVDARTGDAADPTERAAPGGTAHGEPDTEPETTPETTAAASDEPLLDLYQAPVLVRAAPAPAVPIGAAPRRADVVPAEGAPPTSDSGSLFMALGIPGSIVSGGTARPSVAQQLLGVLEGIEPAPPVLARRGQVVAVVGARPEALAAAALLAEQLGQTIEDVVVAGPDVEGFHTLRDATSAEHHVSLWSRCGVPFVVAVCTPDGRDGSAWARDVLEALDPVTVWGAVTAERKPEDISAWAQAVGGVDALAVSGCDRTASPAAVLATGLPVATIDGRRATPAAWTATLVERLTV